MNLCFEHQPLRVHQGVALPPLYLFAWVVASFLPHPGGIDALAVDDAGPGLGVSSEAPLHPPAKDVKQPLPCTAAAPGSEVVVQNSLSGYSKSCESKRQAQPPRTTM